jgi:hypothetical protein
MPSIVVEGSVFTDVDIIIAVNAGIIQAFTEDAMSDEPIANEDFVKGVSMTLELYRRVHAGILSRHAADLVPDFAPDN